MDEEDIVDIDGSIEDDDGQYYPGWCPWCGDPESACRCDDTRPEEIEMDEWKDDEEEGFL